MLLYQPNQRLGRAILLMCWCLLLFSIDVHSRDVFTIDRFGDHDLSNGAYFIEDPSGEMSIQDVMGSNQWQRNYKNGFMFGYTESAYWMSATIKVKHADRWYVVLTYPILDYVDLYWTKDAQILQHFKAGDRIPYAERAIKTREFVFHRDLKANDTITLYMRVKTQGSYQVPIKLKSNQVFQDSLSESEFMLGMFYGVLFIMSVYNLVLYLITRVSSYLYYVIYVIITIFSRMAFDGSGYELLWPDSPSVNEWVLPIGFQLSCLAFWLFTYRFLAIRNASAPLKVMFGVIFLVMMTNLILMPFMNYTLNIQIQSFLSALILFIALVISMLMAVTGSWYAAVFCIATMLSSLAFSIALLGSLGKFNNPDFSIYIYAYARVLEVILFAIALGVRIRYISHMRSQAEQEAQTSRELSISNLEQYQRLYENALTCNGVLSVNGNITSANRAFRQVLGIDLNAHESGSIEGYFEHRHIWPLLEKCRGTNPIAEAELPSREGKWVSMLLHRVSIDEEHEFECTFVDITDRKASERVQEQAQQDKMGSLQQLVVGIAREINTPLETIHSQSDLTREKFEELYGASTAGTLTKDAFEQNMQLSEDALRMTDQQVIRLGEMISSFKKVSVQQMSYSLETLNIKSVLEHLTESAKASNLSITQSLHDECSCSFMSYPMAINWILNELVNNALTHGKHDRILSISCQISLTNQKLEIKFSDNGQDVGLHSLENIFDPFYTTKKETEQRLGLGLYQTYNLVTQLLKGEISAVYENGMTICITIPNLGYEERVSIAGGQNV